MTKTYKYLLIILTCFFITPLITKADCSYEREAELSRIASNVKFSYTYEIDENLKPNFTVQIMNVTNDIYISDDQGHTYQNQSEFSQTYLPGERITYTIYTTDDSCAKKEIMNYYLTIPFFNYYSLIPECKASPEFYLCRVWANSANYTVPQIIEKLNEYKAEANSNLKTESNQSWLEKIKLAFSEKNKLLQLISILVAAGILVMLVIIRKVKL